MSEYLKYFLALWEETKLESLSGFNTEQLN